MRKPSGSSLPLAIGAVGRTVKKFVVHYENGSEVELPTSEVKYIRVECE